MNIQTLKQAGRIAGFAVIGLLGACKNFEGRLNAYSTFNVREKNGTVKQVPQGEHFMKLNVGSQTTVKVSLLSGGTATFKLPKVDPNNTSGRYDFAAAQIGQSFDVQGRSESQSWDGEVETHRESCVYDTYTVPVCRDVCYRDGNGNTHCRSECSYETRYIYGDRTVQGYTRYTRDNLVLNFKNPGAGSAFARFTGTTKTSSNFVRVSTGPCRR